MRYSVVLGGCTWFAVSCAPGSVGTGPAEVPSCLEVHSAALSGPAWQELRLRSTGSAASGRAMWRVQDRTTTRGQWRWQADTLYLDLASAERLPGARGALDPRGSRFTAALVRTGAAWAGTGRREDPAVWRSPVEAVRARPCP